eukprot:CAMPEP_0178470128 /NCGR_PEP_ID=MMETSP0696-20121128/366_1 /TAXON_ID=265572 /ORGANISM="Extubocellulus spinifer, Strain CCMP396" /LENGTH=41 /DNA_ID= /DNA_START= /DNA_END= /DNA_ORIENTATION=
MTSKNKKEALAFTADEQRKCCTGRRMGERTAAERGDGHGLT